MQLKIINVFRIKVQINTVFSRLDLRQTVKTAVFGCIQSKSAV